MVSESCVPATSGCATWQTLRIIVLRARVGLALGKPNHLLCGLNRCDFRFTHRSILIYQTSLQFHNAWRQSLYFIHFKNARLREFSTVSHSLGFLKLTEITSSSASSWQLQSLYITLWQRPGHWSKPFVQRSCCYALAVLSVACTRIRLEGQELYLLKNPSRWEHIERTNTTQRSYACLFFCCAPIDSSFYKMNKSHQLVGLLLAASKVYSL